MLFLTKLHQVVQSCPLIPANTMLGICVIPVVALCCSAHMCCAMEHGIACCAMYCTAIETLTKVLLIKKKGVYRRCFKRRYFKMLDAWEVFTMEYNNITKLLIVLESIKGV